MPECASGHSGLFSVACRYILLMNVIPHETGRDAFPAYLANLYHVVRYTCEITVS